MRKEKHAILITAYKNVDQLNHLIGFFPKEVNLYIHIDKKYFHIKDSIIQNKNIRTYSIYNVNWGSLNHTKTILFLSEQALMNDENVFFHLISGEDYPCMGNFDLFHENIDINTGYLEWFSLPYCGWNGNGGLDRLYKYHLNDVLNIKNINNFNCFSSFERSQIDYRDLILPRENIYEEFGMKLFGGSTWWSLSREVLQYVVDFTKNNPLFLKRFENTFVSEEIYFQTIILNSHLVSNIENDNLRYIDWNPRTNNSLPCYLDETDFLKIYNSNKLFSRKMCFTTVLKFKEFIEKRAQ